VATGEGPVATGVESNRNGDTRGRSFRRRRGEGIYSTRTCLARCGVADAATILGHCQEGEGSRERLAGDPLADCLQFSPAAITVPKGRSLLSRRTCESARHEGMRVYCVGDANP
jgi:hypothetical protein